MKLKVVDLYQAYGISLGLEWSGKEFEGVIEKPHVQRPGLILGGAVKDRSYHSLLIFGGMELKFLKGLTSAEREKRLKYLITKKIPCVIVSSGFTPPKELMRLCKTLEIPLFKTEMASMPLQTKISMLLTDYFAPTESVHGTLVEAYGIGVLIQGESSVGKSEAALGLIERGHRLISDDVVLLKTREGVGLIGCGHDLNKHFLEIRGIGIINVAHLYGAVSVRTEVPIDVVIHLEEWDETHYYDRVGLEERFKEFLGVRVPAFLHPVKPGRDTVLLIETTLLNYRLKEMGYHSAKEFNQKLLEEIARKKGLERKS